MTEATGTTDPGAPKRGAVHLDDLSVSIQTTDLSKYPNNPFQGVAIVTGQTGTPRAFLTTIATNSTTTTTVNPSAMPTAVGTTWTFTFGSSTSPVTAGDYLFTVYATNGSNTVSQTIAVNLYSP